MYLMKPIARYRVFDVALPTIGRGRLRQLHNQFLHYIDRPTECAKYMRDLISACLVCFVVVKTNF